MNGLAGFRTQYPQYNDMPDEALADALHTKYYADIPKASYFQQLGIGTKAGDASAVAQVPSGTVANSREMDPYTGEGAQPEEPPTGKAPFFGKGGTTESLPEQFNLSLTSYINGLPNLMRALAADAGVHPGPEATQDVAGAAQQQVDAGVDSAAATKELKADPEFQRRQDVAAGIGADLKAATPENQGLPGDVASGVAQSMPSLAAGAVVGLINPLAGVAVGVGGGMSQQAQQSYDETGDISFSRRQGLYEGLGEAAGMKAILAPAKSVLAHVIRAATAEFGQEAGTQLAQDIDDRLTHNPEMTLGDIMKDVTMWYDVLVAGLSGTAMGVGVSPVVHGVQVAQQKAQEHSFNNHMEDIAREDMERTLARKISPDDVAWRLLQPPRAPLPPGSFGPGVDMAQQSGEPSSIQSSQPSVPIPTPLPGVFTTQPGVDPTFISNPYVQHNELGEQLISKGTQLTRPVFGARDTLDKVRQDIAAIRTATGDPSTKLDTLSTQPDTLSKVSIEAQKVARQYLQGSDTTLSYLADRFQEELTADSAPQFISKALNRFVKGLQTYGLDLAGRAHGAAFGIWQTTQIPVLSSSSGQIIHSLDTAEIGTQFDGKTKLAPGKVIAIGQALPQNFAKPVVEVLTKWLKTFNPDAGVVVIPEDQTDRYGGSWVDPQGNMMISLNVEKLTRMDGTLSAKLPETLVHELGHHIGAWLFRISPKEIQQALIKAWNEDSLNSLDVSYSDLLNSRRGPAWLDANDHGVISSVRDLIASEYGSTSRSTIRDYSMNFDEWLAHNFERILAGNVYNWQSPVRRFMQDAFKRFKALFNIYQQEFAPNATFKQFLDYHIARNQSEIQAQRLSAIESAVAQQPGAWKSENPADVARQAQELILGTDPIAVGDSIGNFLKWGNRDDERNHTADVRDHVEWSKIKKVTYTLLQVAKLNPQLKTVYDPIGVRDPQTGQVKQGYVDYALAFAAEKMSWMSRADEWLHGTRNLSRAEQDALAKYSYAQVTQGKFFDGNDPTVRQNYNLTNAVVDQYNRMTEMFQSFLTAAEDTLRAEAMKRIAKNPFASGELAAIKKRFDALRAQPYAPLVRYGEFVTKVLATKEITIDGTKHNPGDTIYREHFDTKRQRRNAESQIQGMFPSGLVAHDVLPDDIRSMAGMPSALLDVMKDKLGLTNEQQTMLQQYIYESAPAQSFVKRLMQRRGVLGYSFDLQRGFANYFLHGANHLARIKYNDLLIDARARLHADTNAQMQLGGDVTNQREIENYITNHFKFIMNPGNDWAAFRGVVATSFLGGIIKTAFSNLTQVPINTYSHLAQKYGDVAAINAIRKAYSDQYKAYRVLKPMGAEQQAAMNKWVQGSALSASEESYIRAWTGMDSAKRDDLMRAQRDNTIDQSQAMELAAMSEGQWLSRFKATDELGYYARSFGQAIMIPFQLAERLNRRVTFMAAHDLATNEGLTGETRYQAAKAAVDETQFNYEKWNRPEMLRGKKGVFMMFMQYQLNNLHMATNGFSGNVAKWNWRWWALMLATGGLLGLPFAENMMDLAEWALLKLYPNKRIDIRHELKKLVGEFASNMQSAPDIFMHGLSRYGFGIVPFADLSGSISMGRLIPGTDVLLASAKGASWDDALAKAVTEAGGASSSLVLRMMQMIASNEPDTWKKIERGLPMTMMQNVSASLRWYARGAEETSKGGNVVTFDPSDPWQAAEMIGKSQGFTPTRLANAREDLYIKQDMARYYQTRKGMLLNAVDDARQHGDTEAVTKAVEAIREFNSEVPIRALGITGEELRNSLISREKARALQNAGEGTNKTEQLVGHAIDSGQL